MIRAYLLLGSNTGDRNLMMDAARVRIGLLVGNIVAESSLYETAAWGNTEQPPFLNQAIALDTDLDPHLLLSTLLAIEKSLGRVRTTPWAPRPIDIDILLYGDVVIHEPELTVPHPSMPERRFALMPLNEIASELMHPVLQKTISELLTDCKDTLSVTVAKG